MTGEQGKIRLILIKVIGVSYDSNLPAKVKFPR